MDVRLQCFRGELFARRFHLPTAERVDQIVGEDEAAALPLGETLVDDLFSAVLRRFGHLHAEAAAAKRGLTPRTSP